MNQDKIKLLLFCGYDTETYASQIWIKGDTKIHINDVDFKTDWNFLMQAVLKINSMGYVYKTGNINNQSFAQFSKNNDIITSSVEKTIIESTYNIVIDLIKHLNK